MKKTLSELFAIAIIYAIVLAFICFAWIGAEYRIDGDVHFSTVDGWVAALIAMAFIDHVFDISKKKKKNGTTNEQSIL